MSANQPTLALQSLAAAFENGYSVEQAKLDPEFGGLRGNPQFEDLIKKMATQRK